MGSERKVKPLAALEAKARQVMLMIGLGFIAFVGGTIIQAMLMKRIEARVVAANSQLIYWLVFVLIGQMWILFVLPTLIHLAARFLELPVWRASILAVLTGTAFNAAIRFVSNGIEATFADTAQNLIWGATLIAGTLLSVWGGKQGRAWADERQKLADQQAAARKGQYEQFLAESTALAERRELAGLPAPGAEPPGQSAPSVPPPPGDPKA